MPQPEEAALHGDEAASVRDCLQKLWRQQPRASEQLKALILKYFDELDDVTIAERLDTPWPTCSAEAAAPWKKLEVCLRRSLEMTEAAGPT
ncbi:MAG: hypothetical protein IPO15_20870 [Anaerolineae bacterium]|uniref:hypothetical protein n=1 Tax=Candidatus Amarolinea dominans TaxID=3140696 RepID=UPI0031350B63|nr:hypothetical protein [Anaerolineae bacterium]